jgi:predicted TPR repeat methyltransferase
MSISYVPAYAEVAWHTGHTEEAMKLFTQYLQQVPADLKTYMRLGKLYQKEGISDAARMAFNHVLEQDPGNKAAKIMLQSLDQPQEEKQYDNA